MKFERWKNRKYVREILDGKTISKKFEDEVTKVLENRNVTTDRMKNLAYWVKFDIDDNYLDRFDRLLSLGVNDSSSKESHILRYGECEGLKRFKEKSKKSAITENTMIKKYGKIIGLQKWEEYKNKISFANSKEGYIAKYGLQLGTEKYSQQCKRNSGNLTLERKIELLGIEQGLKEFEKMQINQGKKYTLENYIRKYGIDLGKEKWKKHQQKLKKSYSDISVELFTNLEHSNAKFGENEELLYLTIDEYKVLNKLFLKPDFLFENKIIEFFGDFWHANPKISISEEKFKKINKMTIDEKRNQDRIRIEVLEKRGFSVKIVWESDYLENKSKIINECNEFLKK